MYSCCCYCCFRSALEHRQSCASSTSMLDSTSVSCVELSRLQHSLAFTLLSRVTLGQWLPYGVCPTATPPTGVTCEALALVDSFARNAIVKLVRLTDCAERGKRQCLAELLHVSIPPRMRSPPQDRRHSRRDHLHARKHSGRHQRARACDSRYLSCIIMDVFKSEAEPLGAPGFRERVLTQW